MPVYFPSVTGSPSSGLTYKDGNDWTTLWTDYADPGFDPFGVTVSAGLGPFGDILIAGTQVSSPGGICRAGEAFTAYDTTGIPASATITNVLFTIFRRGSSVGGGTDFDLEVRSGFDYGATFDQADWRNDDPVLSPNRWADLSVDASISADDFLADADGTIPLTLANSCITKAGITYLMLGTTDLTTTEPPVGIRELQFNFVSFQVTYTVGGWTVGSVGFS